MQVFVTACTLAKRAKPLWWRTPFKTIRDLWTLTPDRFKLDRTTSSRNYAPSAPRYGPQAAVQEYY